VAAKKAEETNEVTPEERDRRLQKAYTAATQELRQTHRDEFNDAYSRHASELGVEWRPRPSAEQKAEEQFDALLPPGRHNSTRGRATTKGATFVLPTLPVARA
jgi:hypothetical protein